MIMDEKTRLLRVREKIKSKRPKFVRYESWRYIRVKESWRKPRGIDSKVREKVKGWIKMPSVGYRGPRDVRGLHPSGYVEVLIHNLNELEGLDPNTHILRLSHTLGAKKRITIIDKAKELGFKIINPFIPEKPEEKWEKLEEIEAPTSYPEELEKEYVKELEEKGELEGLEELELEEEPEDEGKQEGKSE